MMSKVKRRCLFLGAMVSLAMCGPEMCVVNATPPDLGSIKLKNFEWRSGENYVISDWKGFENLCQLYKNGDAKHRFPGSETITRMTKDVVVPKGTNFSGIGEIDNKFEGTFDGENHTIYGLVIKWGNNQNNGPAALFSYVGENGIVRNVNLAGGSVVGSKKTAGLIGENEGLVENCSNANTINGTAFVGGVVGYNEGGTVRNCRNSANVTSTGLVTLGMVFGDSAGGVVGNAHGGAIINNTNTGAVKGTVQVGGIVGHCNADVLFNHNSGPVCGWAIVGGVAGQNKAKLENCTNTANVTSLPGNALFKPERTGGIIGVNESSQPVVGCVNNGRVRGDAIAGGLVGIFLSGDAVNCVNVGEVIGRTDVGGIAGQAGSVTFVKCLNLGTVQSIGTASGENGKNGTLLGEAPGNSTTFNNCFYAHSDRTSGAVNGHDVEGATAVTLQLEQRQHIEALVLEDVKTAQNGGTAKPCWLAEITAIAGQHPEDTSSHIAEPSSAATQEEKEKEQEKKREQTEDTEEKGNEEETESQKDDVLKAGAPTPTPYDTIRSILIRNLPALDALRNQESQKNHENDLLGMALGYLQNPKDRKNAEPSQVGGPCDVRDEKDDVDVDDDPKIPDLNFPPPP
ncbi:hypothetical protein FACS189481_5030 [Clostridia bacterium]|nr:hypothetical protein FACS189481_5030 [Clostridia bacterium]